jgi:hypothetical protein
MQEGQGTVPLVRNQENIASVTIFVSSEHGISTVECDRVQCRSDLPDVLQIVVIVDPGGAECDSEVRFYPVHFGSIMLDAKRTDHRFVRRGEHWVRQREQTSCHSRQLSRGVDQPASRLVGQNRKGSD